MFTLLSPTTEGSLLTPVTALRMRHLHNKCHAFSHLPRIQEQQSGQIGQSFGIIPAFRSFDKDYH
jgi:hypothetical protein